MADTGGPAFPTELPAQVIEKETGMVIDYTQTKQPGMTLRDWFAGQALAGLMANSEEWKFWKVANQPESFVRQNVVVTCYQLAETMIEEKRKREAPTEK